MNVASSRRQRAASASLRLFGPALAGILLVACGGGGGGGGSSTPAGSFTLSATTAAFSAYQNAAAPANSRIAMNITGSNVAFVGAAYANGQTQPPWLSINITGAGRSFNVVIGITQTALAPGQYTSTFAVGTADGNGNVLRQQNITVTYTVTARLAMTAAPLATTFIFGDTRTTEPVALNVQAAGRQWTLASSATWLPVPGASQSGNGSIATTIDAGNLAPGNYTATVRATNDADIADTTSVSFTVAVTPASLTVVENEVLLGGADGRSSTLQQAVHFSVATGNGVHPYTVTLTTDDGGTWLTADSLNGTVGSAGTVVALSASRAGLRGGTYTGQLRISVNVKGVVLTEVRPVTFNTEASRLITTAAGVGLSQVPGRDVLTRSVQVLSNLDRTDIPWTATSNEPWLGATAAGVTGGAVVLTADPTGLAADTTHFATVTIISPDTRVENQQTIRVGLHIASTAPTTTATDADTSFLAASPVEPLVATHGGGSSIDLRNVYTGAIVRTLANVVAQAGGMAWSGDGLFLYVHDRINLRVVALSPATGAQTASYDASGQQPGDPSGLAVAYLRPAGYPMLLTPGSRLFDLATGDERSQAGLRIASYAASLAISPDQSLVAPDFGSVKRLERSALNGGTLLVTDGAGFGTAQGRAGEACVSAAGDRIYSASGAPYDFPASSVATGQVVQRLPGNAYPNSIQCVWNGLVVGGIDGYYSSADVWVYYGPSGAELAQLSSSAATGYRSLIDRGLAVSADGTRLVSVARPNGQSTSQLYFQALPAPP